LGIAVDAAGGTATATDGDGEGVCALDGTALPGEARLATDGAG